MPTENTAPATPLIDLSSLPELATEAETAAFLNIGKMTLANWRSLTRAGKPQGPPFVKLSTMIRYPRAGLAAFLAGDASEGRAA